MTGKILKPGDKVKIKSWNTLLCEAKKIEEDKFFGKKLYFGRDAVFLEKPMKKFCGKIVTIQGQYSPTFPVEGKTKYYRIVEDEGQNTWYLPFFEKKVEWSRPSWDEYFMKIAFDVAERSTCLRRKVGAIAVHPESKRILATGYNGATAGSKHCIELGCLRENVPSGERFELCRAIHAESNLICQAARYGISLDGAWVYCTHKPCYWCLKQLINSGVKKVIYKEDYPHDKLVQELIDQKLIELEKYGKHSS